MTNQTLERLPTQAVSTKRAVSTVILTGGICFAPIQWRDTEVALRLKNYRPLVFRPWKRTRCSLRDRIEQKKALLRVTGPAVLGSHSWGTIEDLFVAAEVPERVKGVFSLDHGPLKGMLPLLSKGNLEMLKYFPGMALSRLPFIRMSVTPDASTQELLSDGTQDIEFESDSARLLWEYARIKKVPRLWQLKCPSLLVDYTLSTILPEDKKKELAAYHGVAPVQVVAKHFGHCNSWYQQPIFNTIVQHLDHWFKT